MDKAQDTEMPRGEALERALAGAYRVYQYNIRQTDELIYRITKGAREGVPEGELLQTAMTALSRCRFSPEETESKIKAFPGVREVIVRSSGGHLTAEIFSDEGYEKDIRENMRQMNQTLPEYRRIAEIKFRDTPFEKTAINKIKRKIPDECYR